MAGMAQGAVDSLLGRLTSILMDEAQLLGGVRGDVEFIKDEMECMNGLLLHLTEAQHRDHQVRAWMKQIVGLTRDCGGYVELYVHYVRGGPGGEGLLGYIRRIVRFVRTVSVRHQIATRIQELKVRARDVGDRRQRYGVTVPEKLPDQHATIIDRPAPPPGGPEEEEDLRRRELLYGEPPDTVEEGTNRILEWIQKHDMWGRRIICIQGRGRVGKTAIARSVYEHPSTVSSFPVRIWVNFGGAGKSIDEVWQAIHDHGYIDRKKRSFIVLDAVPYKYYFCDEICDDFKHSSYRSRKCKTNFGYMMDNILRNIYAPAVMIVTLLASETPDPTKLEELYLKYHTRIFDVHTSSTRPRFFRRRALALGLVSSAFPWLWQTLPLATAAVHLEKDGTSVKPPISPLTTGACAPVSGIRSLIPVWTETN